MEVTEERLANAVKRRRDYIWENVQCVSAVLSRLNVLLVKILTICYAPER